MGKIINNYQQDLVKSRTEPLLIELNKKDIDNFGDNGLEKVKLFAKEIYDEPLGKTKETNIIYINGDDATDIKHTYLLEKFLDLINDYLKKNGNLKIIKETLSSALSIGAGGLLSNAFGSYIEQGVGLVVDNVKDNMSDFILGTIVENIDFNNEIMGRIESSVFEIINDTTTSFLDEVNESTLYLSDDSKKAISELASALELKRKKSPAESFRFILKLMLSVAIEMPTLLIVQNPHKLDSDSLAILSLLFSLSKDIKNGNEENKHTGLSVMYIHANEEFQPYQALKLDNLNEEQQEHIKKSKILIDQQRLFTQRYAMLERPTSDIPKIAVKSNMFVGRKDELDHLNKAYDDSKKNKDIATLEIISGEPGVGKTKLFKKHIHSLRIIEENGSKLIQLTLLNQVGHSSSNTGLSSLTDSIISEANRLETVKTFKEKIIYKANEHVKSGITGFIKSILGVDKIIDVAIATNDRLDLDYNILKTKQNTIGDLDKQPQNEKEKQFNDLDTAIYKLLSVSDKSMPIVLFIDDLQWIDDTSSEYILTHFVENFNVHIVSTLRPSDGATTLSNALDSRALNEFKIALLNQTDIKGYDKDKNEIKIETTIDTSKIEANSRYLKGLDSQTLQELISQVIQGDKQHQNILADTIIEQLTNETNDKDVITLFAVETINMLCDEKLYSSQDKDIQIEQLILTDTPIRFNDKIEDFKSSLNQTFEVLEKKYKSSLSHYNDTTHDEEKQIFNLMAYAVLEERLNILKIYFKEHGNAAVNTLLLSSLLGAPFSSNIVKNVIEAISITDEPHLKLLKDKFTKDGSTTLDSIHYEIIEEVYEILSRYLVIENAYLYKHNLLETFLDKQFEYLLDKLLGKKNIDARDSLYRLIIEQIKIEEQKQDFYGKDEENLNVKSYNLMLFYKKMITNIIRKASENSEIWYEQLLNYLHESIVLYFNINEIEEAFNYAKESLELVKKTDKFKLNNFSIIRLKSFLLLGKLYYEINSIDEAIKLAKETLDYIDKDNSIGNSDIAYIDCINFLGICYRQKNEMDTALNYFSKVLLHFENNSLDDDLFIETLNNYATTLYINNLFREALSYQTKSYQYSKILYKGNKKKYLNLHLVILNNLALILSDNDEEDEAIYIQKEILEIIEPRYENNNMRWQKQYIKGLNNLLAYFDKSLDKEHDALEYGNKLISILEPLYKENNSIWVHDYVNYLTNISLILRKNHNSELAFNYQTKALKIVESIYNSSSKDSVLWADHYLQCLTNLSQTYMFYFADKEDEINRLNKKAYLLVKTLSSKAQIKYRDKIQELSFFQNEEMSSTTNNEIKKEKRIFNSSDTLLKNKLVNLIFENKLKDIIITFDNVNFNFIINENIDPDYWETPLSIAVKDSNIEISEYLINNGANIETIDLEPNGTVLFCALENNDIEMVSLLLKLGADMHQEAAWGGSPYDYAKDNNLTQIIQIFKLYEEAYRDSPF